MTSPWNDVQRDRLIRELREIEKAGLSAAVAVENIRLKVEYAKRTYGKPETEEKS